MERRAFVGTVCCAVCETGSGCLAVDEPEPEPGIAVLELENHRREESHEFTVRIEDEEGIVFEETRRLGPSGSGDDALAFENPVEPGAYTVRVDVDEYSATVDTGSLIADESRCLRLRFYLGFATLHVEHQSYDRCE